MIVLVCHSRSFFQTDFEIDLSTYRIKFLHCFQIAHYFFQRCDSRINLDTRRPTVGLSVQPATNYLFLKSHGTLDCISLSSNLWFSGYLSVLVHIIHTFIGKLITHIFAGVWVRMFKVLLIANEQKEELLLVQWEESEPSILDTAKIGQNTTPYVSLNPHSLFQSKKWVLFPLSASNLGINWFSSAEYQHKLYLAS